MDGFLRIALSPQFDSAESRRYLDEELRYPALYISIAYVIIIFSIQAFMSTRKPFQVSDSDFQLTTVLNLWNTWLAVFSVIGSAITTVALFTEIRNHGLVGNRPFLFCVSKIAELGDTIILVLRKKPLIFLHWYHHVLTLNYGVSSMSEKTPYNSWITWLNFSVHAIMYRYFISKTF
ncbi:unnamed protein product [Toxocara canis]|uniref:Elongation of very long chain fatty acids protein n=1 Tax=Toxocara canis TaxID=6265 RepID=A0A183VD44_TOXCA|nr:unnamed protein product [Toxocara canis]